MTSAQRSALRGISGVAAITVFTMGFNFAVDQRRHTTDDSLYITRIEWVKDSAARAAQLNALVSRLDELLRQSSLSGQRLTEICERVRAGCR